MKLIGIVASVFLAGSAGWAFLERRAVRRAFRRKVLAHPLTSVESVREGKLRLMGRARLPEASRPLIAPLSGRECVAWRVVVESRAGSMSGQLEYRELGRRSDARAFRLDDGTGSLSVDGVSRWDLAEVSTGGGGYWHELTSERMRALLQEVGVRIHEPGWERELRVQELICPVGASVVVAGHGRWETDTRTRVGYREVGRVFRLLPSPSDGLIATTDRRVLRQSSGRAVEG